MRAHRGNYYLAATADSAFGVESAAAGLAASDAELGFGGSTSPPPFSGFLLSFTYQPDPLKTIPTGYISRFTAPSHSGHVDIASSFML